MKKNLIFFMLFISVYGMAQNYPINGINITQTTNPDANTDNWGTGTSLFMITASSRSDKGRLSLQVEDSKILVIIKKNGSKICGSYSSSNAPDSGFNTTTKVWGGKQAVGFLGDACVLPPGDYELSVQFFGADAVGLTILSEEKTKVFTIKETEHIVYQPPQTITPANGTELNEKDIKGPVIFRWLPPVPVPPGAISYRLKIWQLRKGQPGTQAMKSNQPIFTKDVDNITQVVVSNIFNSSDPNNFVWNVQALNREGKPIGENNGMSHAFGFNFPNIIEQKVTYNEACKYLSVDFMVDRKIYTGDSGGVEIYITNRNKLAEWKNKPTNFRIKIMSDAVIVNADQAPNGWKRTPSKFPPGSTEVKWTASSGDFPVGEINLGSIVFINVKSEPVSVQYEWLNKDDKVICSSTRTLDMTDLGTTQKVKLISPTDGHIGSAQVSVNLLQPPRNQLIATDLWNGTLTNTSKNTLHITLSGTLKSAAEGKVLEAQSKLITLPPGTKRFTFEDFKSGNIKTIFDRWGKQSSHKNAPDGDYTICVYVKNEKGEEIGEDCIKQKIRYDVSNAGTTQSLKLIGSFIVYKSNKSDQVIFKEFVHSNTNNTETLIGKFMIEKNPKSDKVIFKNN